MIEYKIDRILESIEDLVNLDKSSRDLIDHLASTVLWDEPLPDWADEDGRNTNENGLYGGKNYDQEQSDTLEMFIREARMIMRE